MSGRRCCALIAALLAVAASLVAAGPASAAKTASVTLTTLTPKIDVGDQPTFEYSTTGVPADGQVRLQRLISGIWTTVQTRLPGTDKTVKDDPLSPYGKYSYRMRAFDHDGHQIAETDHAHTVYVFKDFSIESLCPHTVDNNRICKTVHVSVNGTNYDMHMALGSQIYPNYFNSANLPNTSCRSAALRFATKTANTKTYLKFVQGSTSKVASTPAHTLGHFNPTGLTSATLFFDASVQSGVDNSVYVDGTMNCWTHTGRS